MRHVHDRAEWMCTSRLLNFLRKNKTKDKIDNKGQDGSRPVTTSLTCTNPRHRFQCIRWCHWTKTWWIAYPQSRLSNIPLVTTSLSIHTNTHTNSHTNASPIAEFLIEPFPIISSMGPGQNLAARSYESETREIRSYRKIIVKHEKRIKTLHTCVGGWKKILSSW